MQETGGCLSGKVVIVTGAGRGIGREIALLAAREGAAVVVNDLGGAADGTGADQAPAAEVVEEIERAAGTAAVSTHSVADPAEARAIVETALDRFGRIDAVINNAGILRDRIFHHLSQEDWEAVISVHLHGSFQVARAAAEHFRRQGSGAYVHFTSTSGLIGNFGQANYAAAKMGIVGLSRAIALDMARFGVRSNCIAPFAWSRLIESIPARTEAERVRVERMRSLTPEKVAPLAVYLVSDLAREVTGQIFAVRRNEIFLISQPRPLRSIHRDGGWTPVTIHDHLLPAFRPSMYPLERTADIFNWDPI